MARSSFTASSNAWLAASPTSLMASSGARWRGILRRAFVSAASAAFRSAAGAGSSETGWRASRSARGTASAAATGSSSCWSISPICSASAVRMLRPSGISDSAAFMPTSRGRRCVPPDPGTTPRMTSGSPSCAVGAAMRQRQASASSRPPPRHAPLIAAMTGTGADSSAATTAGRSGDTIGRPNSPASAPAAKISPAPARMIRSTSLSPAMAASAATSPARIS